MNDERMPRPDESTIWATIRFEPDEGAVEALWAGLSSSLDATPQRPRRVVTWPWSSALPGISRQQPRVPGPALAALAVVGLVAVMATIGLIAGHRVPPPFGLAKPGLIAFDDGGDIVVVEPDGTGRRALTSGPADDVRPTWSPDGTLIAYWSLPPGGTVASLMVMDGDGSQPRVAATNELSLDVSGRPVADWLDIAWSPDSRFVAFTGGIIGQSQVEVARADGSASARIGDPALLGQTPSWSPDGKRLAFRGGRADRERGVYVMNADGSDIVRLTKVVADDDGNTYSYFQPIWSPDGASILYSRMVGISSTRSFNRYQVFAVGADGGSERALSDDQTFNANPVWSPDGSRVAYMQWRGEGPSHVVVVRADGSDPITIQVAGWASLHWSPDGLALVSDGTDRNTGVVVSSLADGKTLTIPLTSTVATDTDAGATSWQRLAR